MCGIAGFVCNNILQKDTLNNMLCMLHHRGPDGQGSYVDGKFNGGHTRLSINDLEHGAQPLYNENGSVVVMYNGEIYNYSSLKTELELKGYKFRTHSDGEVICHLYDEYGVELFNMLDGMFAISLWDKNKKTLYLARDYIGEKPLYYSKLSNNELIYASELKALKKHPSIKLKLNKQAIWDYLSFLWVPEPQTVYEDIFALPPGHIISINNEEISIKKYAISDKKLVLKNKKDLVSCTKEIVTRSIKSRLISDVPVGSFLSGGIDSSIISAIAAKQLKKESKTLYTYTIGFESGEDPYGGDNDESLYAKEFSERIGSIHKTIKVRAKDFKGMLNDFVYYADQPFGVSSGLGIFAITQQAYKDGIKVLLSGDGADEMFGGYSWYKYLNKPSKFNKTDTDVTFHNNTLPVNEKIDQVANVAPQKRAWAWHYYASEKDKRNIFSENFTKNIQSSIRFFEAYKASSCWNAVDFIKQDREFYLPNEMLRKADRMGMANSVEVRVPFVSKEIYDFVEPLSYEQLIHEGDLKILLKKGFEDIIGSEVINRPKHGFNVPIDLWLKNDWQDLVEQAFNKDSFLHKLDIISSDTNTDFINYLLNDKEKLHGHTILCLITLELWLNKEYETNSNYC
jgi:asparagine synthase (glutamine-hydrolysing)